MILMTIKLIMTMISMKMQSLNLRMIIGVIFQMILSYSRDILMVMTGIGIIMLNKNLMLMIMLDILHGESLIHLINKVKMNIMIMT